MPGCSSGVFLLAVPLGGQSGLCSSSSRSGSLQASGLDWGGGGLLPLDLRGSGVGTVSFRPFSDGCLSLHWQAWRDRGPEPWVVVVLRFGYCLPFLGSPPFSMLRSLYFLTAPLPSRVLLWRRSPWPLLPWVQWSLLLSLLQGFLQPSLRDVVVLGVLASSRDPLPSPLFL